MNKVDVINRLEEKVLAGLEITQAEAQDLAELDGPDLYRLFTAASRIRDLRVGKKVELCAILMLNLVGVQKTVNFVPNQCIIRQKWTFMICWMKTQYCNEHCKWKGKELSGFPW
ncbi:hypothetical protein [Desulfosporosinus sp. OT]|uniref:hypothetical protein n=1 Tax=Desulfosporosinus sp. OT TaxID=913865 RepID=UPI0002239BB6|nr:hypothetical protein [Desulfosporosinus sp. OT]EGW37414.1 biotin synthase [Desulfosporosinus sp. OT]